MGRMDPHPADFLGVQFLQSGHHHPTQSVRIDRQLAPQHPARNGQREPDQVRLGFAAQPRAHLSEFLNGARQPLDHRL